MAASPLAQVKLAVLTKATRLLLAPRSSLGVNMEVGGDAAVPVPMDHWKRELLYGVVPEDIEDVDIASLVTVDDVISEGLQLDPEEYSEKYPERLELIQDCIDAAASMFERRISGRGIA